MKVLKVDDDNYVIYLLNINDQSKLEDKTEIIKLVKDTVLRANKIYCFHMRGFYKVRVYLNKRIGLVIEIISVDDISISNSIDLRVLVYFDQDFYFEVTNYDFLPLHKKIIYVDDKFYVDVNFLSNYEILLLLERGNLIYKLEEVDNLQFGKVLMN